MSADFWAGYISGAAGIIIGNPLDLIKVRLQAAPAANQLPTTSRSSSFSSTATALPAAQRPKPRIHTLRDALRGLPAPVLTYGALNALLFTTYNRSLFLLSHPSSDPSSLLAYDLAANGPTSATYPYWAHFTAGALAGLATFIISAPTELIKCRAQVLTDTTPSSTASTIAPRSSWQIAKTILSTQGITGLYHGGVVTSVRDALGYGAYFVTYEAGKELWDSMSVRGGGAGGAADGVGGASWGWSPGAGNETAKILLCGGVAGIATWASIFPLDVIKTRVQTQTLPALSLPSASAASTGALAAAERAALLAPQESALGQPQSGASGAARRAGAWTVAVHAYRTEGGGVFFRGLTVCCVRAFIVNAVQWAVYEWMIRGLQ